MKPAGITLHRGKLGFLLVYALLRFVSPGRKCGGFKMAECSKNIAALAHILIFFFYVLYVYLLLDRAGLPVVVYSPVTKTKRLPTRAVFSVPNYVSRIFISEYK